MTQQALRDHIQRTVTDLWAAGIPVTFTAVAAHTQISRATLYRHPELRALVEAHRTRPTISALLIEVHQLRAALEAVATRTRRQEERLRRLEGRTTTTHQP
jgi:hypothetical protein